MVAADIVKGTKLIVRAPHNHDWLARNIGGDVLAGIANLLSTAHHLPSVSENGSAFQRGNIGVDVPSGWNSARLGKRGGVIVQSDNLFQIGWLFHHCGAKRLYFLSAARS
jgi:hypothetical protein